MKIGIIGAMAQEVDILVNLMSNKKIKKIANCTLFDGQINGKDVTLLQSGIGKVAATIGTTLLLQMSKPDIVINTGSAAGVAQGLSVGDIVVSSEICYHDVDVTAFGYKKGQLPACPPTFTADQKLITLAEKIAIQQKQHIQRGLICSGDSFIHGGESLTKIKTDFPYVVAIEMEAAAIAHTCYQFNIPFVVVRAISDAGDGEAGISFDEFLPIAAQKSSQMIIGMLAEI